MDVKIKYFGDALPLNINDNGSWIDLRSAFDYKYNKGDLFYIRLGVAMKLPIKHEGILAPRSSLFKRHFLIVVNSIGIIDNSFCGDSDEWMLCVLAFEDGFIRKHERVAQFRIIESMGNDYEFIATDMLCAESRGGFGSTGVF